MKSSFAPSHAAQNKDIHRQKHGQLMHKQRDAWTVKDDVVGL